MVTKIETLQDLNQKKGTFRAGGTDINAKARLGIKPGSIVDLNGIDNLKQIETRENGALDIGALVTIQEFASNPEIIKNYPGLSQAASGLATPQIRNMATIGGSLLQSSRCPYFRNPAFNCFKKGGNSCPARKGNHEYGVCFDLGPCVFPHPSTLGMALLTYDARLAIHPTGNQLSLSELYGTGHDPKVDHLLDEQEVITHVSLSSPLQNEKAAYFRTISRFEAEWPLVEVMVRLEISNNSITYANVAMGGVANIPLHLKRVGESLINQEPTIEIFEKAAKLATYNANPLPMTEYKINLVYGSVLAALEKAASS